MAPNRKSSAKEEDRIEHYRTIQAQCPDVILLFRFGDFYEILELAEERPARDLCLALTSRPSGTGGGAAPNVGFPTTGGDVCCAAGEEGIQGGHLRAVGRNEIGRRG